MKTETLPRLAQRPQRIGGKPLRPLYQNSRPIDQSNAIGMLGVHRRVENFHRQINRNLVARVPLTVESRPGSGVARDTLALAVYAERCSLAPAGNANSQR